MPATSRQTCPGTTRSAIVLAGSPSKSMIFQPSRRLQGLAEVEVAVHPLGGERRSRSAAKRGAARRVRPPGPGHLAAAAGQPAVHHLGHRAAGDLGGREGVAQRRVDLGQRPRRAPRRPRRSSPGSQRVQGQAPAVLAPRQLLHHHGQVGVAGRAVAGPAALGPAVEPGDVGDAGPVQRVVHLDVEVAAQLEPAEELDHGHVAEHHRGVALLAGEHRRRQVGGRARADRCAGTGWSVSRSLSRASSSRARSSTAGLRVVGGVVGDHRPELRWSNRAISAWCRSGSGAER